MQRLVRSARAVRGTIVPPGDKSISHRAAIFNAIADGEAVVEGFQRSGDCMATLNCLRALGVDWRWRDESTLSVRGRGRHALREPDRVLECRNSGTTMRLLAGLLAPQPFFSVLSGDRSLLSRPMARIIRPLRLLGADVSGRGGDTRPPLAIRGAPLNGVRYRMPVASAQVKSALILAALYASGETVLEQPGPTRDHTERLLGAMGAAVRSDGSTVSVAPLASDLSPLALHVPGDISAAAAWLILGACHPDAELHLQGVGVNPTRTGILDVLRLMGADVALEEERTWGPEPVADLTVRSSRLRGAIIEGELVPRAIDELPLVALAACFAESETVIRDAAELRVKESDRIRATARELRSLGADVRELPDGLHIRPSGPLHGAAVSSHGDHRLAIMLALAGALATGETVVRNAGAVAVSYTGFWRDLDLVSVARSSRAGRGREAC
ncbi:MAG TPA: 3-phosphoshikimate 1-carboxyvinyltransferase [Dehalococcoidia bacterium]|nr:3-phosphoshikimate 1-carboxyvinyltransferase [Dehalococcoidia bacterium]